MILTLLGEEEQTLLDLKNVAESDQVGEFFEFKMQMCWKTKVQWNL